MKKENKNLHDEQITEEEYKKKIIKIIEGMDNYWRIRQIYRFVVNITKEG